MKLSKTWVLLASATADCTMAERRTYQLSDVRHLSTLEPSEYLPSIQAPSVLSGFPTTSPVTSSPVSQTTKTIIPVASRDQDNASTSIKHSSSFLIPLFSIAILTWALKRNTNACGKAINVRERAFQACRGAHVDGCCDGEYVPGEIVIQGKPPSSVAANSDVELMPMSTFDVSPESVYGTPAWHSFPEDPVDEVSLKGSSFYCSSDDEDEENGDAPLANYTRMEN